MKYYKLSPDLNPENKTQLQDLRATLTKLNFPVQVKSYKLGKIDKSISAALKKIQKENKLDVNGNLSPETIAAINTESHHRFVTNNKYRTASLHTLLSMLNIKVDKKDLDSRTTGESTVKAIKEFQKKQGLTETGKLSEEVLNSLQDAVIKETLNTKTKRGGLQNTLKKINKISKLNIDIAENELKEKVLGETSIKLIRAFQEKYRLPVTGEINKATLDKINSVAASKGTFINRIKSFKAKDLTTVNKTLRLNMVSPKVAQLQKTLSFLGYKLSDKEFNTQTFGNTTVKALLAFQKQKGIAETGHYDKATQNIINQVITTANPGSKPMHRYRIRGSVRNELWQRKNNMVIKIFEKGLDNAGDAPLASKKNFLNGFFDIAYDAPIDPVHGNVKDKFHLAVKLYNSSDQQNPVAVQTHYNVKPIHWVNFVESRNAEGAIEYSGKFLGESDFEVTRSIILKAIHPKRISDLHETTNNKQISQLSLQTNLSTDDIMRQVLSELVAQSVNVPIILDAEIFYSFIRQNLPADLPGELLLGTSEWETISQLIELAASGIIFLDEAVQEQAIDNAINQNLVSQKIKVNKAAILNELKNQRSIFALNKPILVGNGSLVSLLNSSKIEETHYKTVASVFVKNRGINTSFWEEISKQSQIGSEAINDFASTIETGNISKNHLPTLTFLKSKIGSEPGKFFKSASDIAKLDQSDIVQLINENGKQVPDNIPGDTPDDKVANYAAAMKSRAEFLYPAVSLVATIKRSNTPKITKITEVQNFLDEQKELNFRQQNIDKYLIDKNITLEPKVKEELKVVQRVHKLSTNSNAASTLVDEGLHSSLQIYFTGKERLTSIMSAKGVDPKHIHHVYEASKMQYMEVLARITDFRREMYRDTPAAIVPHIYNKEEIQNTLGDIPDLETLFGSLDFCDCEHCRTLLSPSAYLTDMLRFLKEHNSLIVEDGKILAVKDILFDRRPDLGNIKLNCDNTNVSLPYIDLVCEILENNINPPQKNFNFQTTLSQKELRAISQHLRPEAYTVLAASDFPISSSFNLWQEEARTYLKHLRVPRWELMETFQDRSVPNNKTPNDISIAAEYFGISSKEKDLIITQRQTAVDQDKYWGFDTTQTSIPVSLFMKKTKLSYYELLELLLVRFVNNPADPDKIKIERPVDTLDLDLQRLVNLSEAKFDLLHRFMRLWRKTGWKMWELDLLIRNPKIGNNKIDGNLLVNLKIFKQLQSKFKLPFEILLAFYGQINREIRIKADNPEVVIQPLYNNLFQNQSITNPVDSFFKAIDNNNNPVDLDNNIILGVNAASPYNGYTPVPTILSALALRQKDFDLLATKTDNHLSVASLSNLLRYSYLARSLKINMDEFQLFLNIVNNTDPFNNLQTTLDLLTTLENIKASGLTFYELDYILNFNPVSPIGLRDESVVQMLQTLRGILENNRNKINRLKLSNADRNSILSFNTDAIPALTDVQLAAALAPLKTILNSAIENFTAASFSVEECNFIIQFNTTSSTGQAKIKLAENIKTLKKNLSDLLQQNKAQIKSYTASSFGLTDEQAAIILVNLMVLPGPLALMDRLEDPALIAKNPDGSHKEITRANFPDHFSAYLLLHKISLLVSRMKIQGDNLKFFILNHESINTINFAALPVSNFPGSNSFAKWQNLFLFLQFAYEFPEPEDASIRSILNLAKDPALPKAAIIDELSKFTQWNTDDITVIDAGFRIPHSAGKLGYTNPETYHRMLRCFYQMKLTGVDAVTMLKWAIITPDINHDIETAQQIRHAVKSKYEQDEWLQKVTPLHDTIREMKRTALVEYHIENSQRTEEPEVEVNGKMIPNPLFWEDSNSLFKYFLIDVEMSSIQLTSRIKQAISSVQLFVQRCFLNLENRFVQVVQEEKEDTSSPNAWSQWRWMKNYRVWEANRKIFFYPENWLEPELRDDKSPFFKELENELLQNEITKENVETAFQKFLNKIDEVSHLEVCGLFHQMEDLNLDEAGYETNIVHVIGRTQSVPNVYYYRTYNMNYNSWSSWEKIDVDIAGDHVLPVVYNRKLHLFWLQFMEKPIKSKKIPPAQPSSSPTTSPEPMKALEIQLGWTIKNMDGWAPKKISKQKLVHPWERPAFSYNLKPFYLARTNELYLDIYLSTSSEFNNGLFYDPFALPANNPVRLTKNRFFQTYLPWHSSSFVFNGEIKDVKLKALKGSYYLPGSNTPSQIDSFQFVHNNFDNGTVTKMLGPTELGPRLKLPTGMHFEDNRLTNNQVHSVNNSQLNVLEGITTTTVLSKTLTPFSLVITQQELQLNTTANDHPMFYQDNQRAFFIKPEWEARLNNYGIVIGQNRKYRFQPFYHPYTMLFIREFNRSGFSGLFKRRMQTNPASFVPANNFNFNSYSPTASAIVDKSAEKDIVDFSFEGANSIYNWELFFHAPLMVACRLMQNQKFEDAMYWFHYIFNPTDIENFPVPQRYWITKPFFEYNSDDYRKQRIESILNNLHIKENADQLKAWRNFPFKPHVIARYRLVSYMKNVVMKYLDNLIAWGDMLFKRDTIESINEATLLYLLAYEILGSRPQKVPDVRHEEMTFNELEAKLDEFGNARVDVIVEDTLLPITVIPIQQDAEPIPKLETLYFAIPANDYLTKYWDTVEDRLFKIRHSMNIEGLTRQLPLFEPPIDPALLVKAAAEGIDLSSVLSDMAAPTPHYRFRVVLQKAIDFCGEVKMLGEKLLSALEKKDSEVLALLRSQHEIQFLEAVKEIRKRQIDEADQSIKTLQKTLELADTKKSFYEGKPDLVNASEELALIYSKASLLLDVSIAAGYMMSGGLKLIPNFLAGAAGFGGSPTVNATMGGSTIGNGAEMAVKTIESIASSLDGAASLSSTVGSYQHRKDEWNLQARLATIEKEQIQFQITASEIRKAISEKELENQELQIENTKTVDDYLNTKFSNEQLYNWMITQLSSVYFQAYQLAFDMAKKAEKCLKFELGTNGSNIIQFGYWDSLKKGLLAGDKLMYDLKRLDAEYVNQNRREFEITKHVSLAQIAPLSLITLKETGQCIVSLPEFLFDMDYPGHFMRRIKNVSVSIPCIAGPYTGINCTLSLLRSETRIDPSLPGGVYTKQEDDTRFKTVFGTISSIATSHGQMDSGIFELTFNDDRYLPFEGSGVISDWQLTLPVENNYFDFASISDVILHVSYTSRGGGGQLSAAANTALQNILPSQTARLFSLRHEFATEWYKFLNPVGGGDQQFVFNLKPELFPFFIRGKLGTLKIKTIDLFVETADEGIAGFTANAKVTSGNLLPDFSVNPDPGLNNVHHSIKEFNPGSLPNSLGEVMLKLKVASAADYKSLTQDQVSNIFILLRLGT